MSLDPSFRLGSRKSEAKDGEAVTFLSLDAGIPSGMTL